MFHSRSYARDLRCIGQELKDRDLEVFQIKSHAGEYRLQAGEPVPPYTGLIEINYSEQILEAIDQRGQARRGKAANETSFDSMAEILRAVGEYVDKNGFLRRIDNSCSPVADQTAIEIEYQTRSGEVCSEILPMNVLREAIIRMHKRRSRLGAVR